MKIEPALTNKRVFKILLVILFLAAFTVRWAFLTGYQLNLESLQVDFENNWPQSAFFIGDAWVHYEAAETFSQNGITGYPYRPPLYTVFLGGVFYLTGATFLTAHLAQIFLGALIPVLFALLSARWFNLRVGIITGWLCAASFQLLMLSATLCSETLFLLLTALALWLLTSPSAWAFSAAGCMMGLAVLTRSEGAVFLVLVVILELFNRQISWKTRLLLPACVILTVLPWSIRNFVLIGRMHPQAPLKVKLVFLSANGPLNFVIGNGPMASGGYRVFTNAMNASPTHDSLNLNDPAHREAFFNGYQAGMDYLLMNPGRIEELVVRKIQYFSRGLRAGFGIGNFPWGLRGVARRGDIWSPETASGIYVLLTSACLGMLLAGRKNIRAVIVIGCFVLAGFANAIVFFGLARNAAMLLPFLFVAIAVLFDSLFRWITNRCFAREKKNSDIRSGRIPVSVSGITGVVFAVWIVGTAIHRHFYPVVIPSTNAFFEALPPPDVSSDEQRREKLARYREALSCVESTDPVVIYEESFSLFLARLAYFVNGDNPEEVLRLLDRALVVDPSNEDAWKLRGLALASNPGRRAESIGALRRYIEINPWASDASSIKELIFRYEYDTR